MTKISGTYRLAAEAHRMPAAERWRAHRDRASLTRVGNVVLGEVLNGTSFRKFVEQFEGYKFMSSGWESAVLESEDDSHVMKVLLRSGTFRKSKAEKTAQEYQKAHDTASQYLGKHLLETVYYPHSMKTMPFLIPGYGVVALQEKVKPVRSYASAWELASEENIPFIADELANLTAGIRNLHRHYGIYPDIRGSHNIFLTEDGGSYGLKIIDTNLFLSPDHYQKAVPGRTATIADEIEERLFAWEMALLNYESAKPGESRAAALR